MRVSLFQQTPTTDTQTGAQVLCEDVKAGQGRVQACLRAKRPQLSWDCQEELFRKEVEDADDLRLNPTLLRLCSKDKKKFCIGAFGSRTSCRLTPRRQRR